MALLQKVGTKVASIFKKKQEKSEVIVPVKKAVVVTDFSDGSSIKTETKTTTGETAGSSTTPTTSTKKTYRGSGGKAVTPEQKKDMDFAKEVLDLQQQEKAKKLAPYNVAVGDKSEAGKKLNSELQEQKSINYQQERNIQTKTENYAQSRFDYYQDLVNKRKLTVDEANAKLKSDIDNYQDALINDENQRRQNAYKNTIDQNAVVYIGEFQGIVDQTSLTPEKTTTWQKVKDVAKAVYVSSPFGTSVKLREDIAEDVKQARYDYTLKSLIGQGVPTVVPFKTSLEAVKKDRLSEYSAEQQIELFTKLNEKIEDAPIGIKYNVQDIGLTYLAEKGLRFDEFTDPTSVSLVGADFDRKVSQNILEWEKARGTDKKIDDWFVGTRIVSTKALEFYGLSKAIGGVVSAGSKLYQSTKLAKTLSSFGDPTVKKVVFGTTKLVGITGVAGLYGIGASQKYKKYAETSEYGKGVFWLETGGELLGLGLAVTEGAMAKKSATRVAKTENALIEQRNKALKNIKLGQYSDKAISTSTEKGVSVKLNVNQQNLLAKEYSRITGVSNKEAMEIIKSKSFYKNVISVKSSAPSYERALKYFRTGKGTAGDDVYRIYRYGFMDTFKTPTGSTQQFAIEFSKKGGYVSNIQLKTVVGKGDVAITNIFTKARASQKYDDIRWILKENVLSKATKSNNLYLIESKLSKIYPYKREALKLTEVLNIGTKRSPLNEFDKLWKSADYTKSSVILGGSKQIPLTLKNELLKITFDDVSIYKNLAVGKRAIPLKNLLKYANTVNTLNTVNKGKLTVTKTPLSSTFQSQQSSTLLKKEILNKVTTKAIQQQVLMTPQQSSLNLIVKQKLVSENIALGLKSQQLSLLAGISFEKTQSKSITKLNEDISLKSLLRQNIIQNISLKSIQTPKTKSVSTQIPLSAFDYSFINYGLTSPVVTSPKIPKFTFFEIEKDKKKKKMLFELSKKKNIWQLGLLPDFTAKAVGLSSPEISVKDIEKQLLRVQTGIDVRTGGKVKWD